MITLCYRSVLCHRPAASSSTSMVVMHFKDEFLEWCSNWPGMEMFVVSKDHNPGYQVDLTYDFEVSGLSLEDEAFWVLRWGKSTRQHPVVFDDNGLTERDSLNVPYHQYCFAVEVSL